MKYLKHIVVLFLALLSIQIFAQQASGFTVASSGVKPDGSLCLEFTGEGEGISMPLEWNNIPDGTHYFAINLWHLPHPTDPCEVKSYWVVYNIPSDIKSMPKNAKGFGSVGYNGKDEAGYDPMKSKGPGVKDYNLTIYALSEKLFFDNDRVYRADLLRAIDGKVLGESTLKYTYETGLTNVSTQQLQGTEERTDNLTVEQKGTMREILSNYDAAALTASEAKAIHEAFREAGLRAGPEVDDVIKEAGFNPDKMKELAPPPSRN